MGSQSTKDALDRYYAKQAKIIDREMNPDKRKRYKAPEKKAVREILDWAAEYGFDLDVIEASKYDRHMQSMGEEDKVPVGFSDLCGVDRFGFACYIEVKANGRRSTVRPHQLDFLIRKIKSGAFACVADSAKYAHELYHRWIVCKLRVRELSVLKPMSVAEYSGGEKNPVTLLLESLPKKKKKATGSTKETTDLDLALD